jgi:CubicO group peptidase (beta-lactamase class C family)
LLAGHRPGTRVLEENAVTHCSTIDHVIDQAVEWGKLVGTVVIVSNGGEPVYRRAAGFADREAGKLIKEDTIFRAASLTKPMIAATILAMADRGLLQVSDPVSTYLPYFRPRLADGTEPVITLSELLTHTAGLTYDYSADPRITAGLTDTEMGLDEVLELVARQPLAYAPGTSWLYSMAIDVLGGVAAKVHGGSLGDALAHYVTGPLGMRDTGFGVTDVERLAVPYGDADPVPERMGEPHAMANPWGGITRFSPQRIFNSQAFQSGGGGTATTAGDFMRLLDVFLSDGAPILKPDTAREALQNQMGFERDPGQAFSFLGSYTADPDKAGHPWPVGTNNWGGIYGHIWSIDPVNQISMVSLSNTAFYGGELDYPRALRRAVYADLT